MAGYEDKNTSVGIQVCDKSVSFELNGEVSLPDYLGEVSRLLWVRPTILPPTKFINGDNAEFSGRVSYAVLYAGADGKLYSTSFEDTYGFSVQLQAPGEAMLSAHVVPDVVVGRVAAPRRLTVHCRAHAHVNGYGTRDLGVSLPGDADEICRLGELQESGVFLCATGDAVELYDEFDADDTRVISARAEVFLPEVSAIGDGVRCKGEVIATLLCCKADGEREDAQPSLPYTVVRRLPLSCEVPLEVSLGDQEARATAVIGEVRAVAEGGRLTVAVRVIPQVEVTCKTTAYYTGDLFMPGMSTVCSYKEERVWLPHLCANKNFSVSATLSPKEMGLSCAATVIDVCAEAEVREKTAGRGQTVLSGELHCHVLYHCEGEYGVAGTDVPFRVVAEGEPDALSVYGCVPVCRIQQDGERMRLDAELQLAMRGSSFATVRAVEGADFSPRETCRRADLELCYPKPGSSLWEIAKQYATSPERIAASNGISDENMGDEASLSGVRYLMIP